MLGAAIIILLITYAVIDYRGGKSKKLSVMASALFEDPGEGKIDAKVQRTTKQALKIIAFIWGMAIACLILIYLTGQK